MSRKLRVLTWHVHGNYLYYLTQTDCQFYVPITDPPRPGYFGKTKDYLWSNNVIEISAKQVKNMEFDCIIFQSNFNPQNPTYNYLQEQTDILSKYQLQCIPKIFIEHDPPRMHPTDTKHPLYNSHITLVHVTSFNQLLWDNGTTPTHVIYHGAIIPQAVKYSGQLKKGIVVINGLQKRGRRLGLDIFEDIRTEVPLDLVGIESEQLDGLGKIPPHELPFLIAKYRFFFYPARYTSFALSLVEAMMVGLPIVTLATTELPMIIKDGINGYISNDTLQLKEKMKLLLKNQQLATQLGNEAKKTAIETFSIDRFTSDWKSLITKVSNNKSSQHIKVESNPVSV